MQKSFQAEGIANANASVMGQECAWFIGATWKPVWLEGNERREERREVEEAESGPQVGIGAAHP